MTEERIQKILARAGYGSRRSCEELITSDRVRVNGKPVILGQKADSQSDKITVDGNIVHAEEASIYIAYNKPRFVLCDKTIGDDTRRTVFDMVEGGSNLAVVGRLDFESEGLVILTNDGDLVNRLTHPRYQHEKEYRVLLASHPDAKQLEVWRRGVVLEDGHRTSPANVTVESNAGKGTWVRVVLKEGHKRQIRETAKMTGLFVVKLIRTRIATLRLGTLKSGESRKLTPEEISVIKDTTRPGRKIGFVKDMSKKPSRKIDGNKSDPRKTYKKSDRKSDPKTDETRKTYKRPTKGEDINKKEKSTTYKKRLG
ncbi:MAG: 23S rRNA pseudouridine synthase [Chloroflexi bacterium]|nr:MAG: 23S rRNA pseudouridine synthase [Chloroflexota bacterium]